ncbi:uncharacterized protein J3R85_007895 [Psidium guajava]|nr:uncharacterized protein J3R85_007895 [Psidium guajava]
MPEFMQGHLIEIVEEEISLYLGRTKFRYASNICQKGIVGAFSAVASAPYLAIRPSPELHTLLHYILSYLISIMN